MSAQTITDRLRSLLAEFDQVAADVSKIDDPGLFFDLATRLANARQPLIESATIAEGAAQAEQIAA